MVKKIIYLLVLPFSTFLLAQEDAPMDVLQASGAWKKEVFQFPIPFAKEIDLEGVADVRFPNGWGDEKSDYFWTYTFGWSLDHPKQLEKKQLESYMQLYFDGLMNAVSHEKGLKLQRTAAQFAEVSNKNTTRTFEGEIKIFDAFFTKRIISLHVIIECIYCEAQKKEMVLFKFSPEKSEHTVWKIFDAVTFKDGNCT